MAEAEASRRRHDLILAILAAAAITLAIRPRPQREEHELAGPGPASEPLDDPPDTALDVEAVRAARGQTRATWISAALAGVALITSLVTWVGQLRINDQQITLNANAQERDEQVYASRVAVWYVAGADATSRVPAGLDASIQNRAPAPVSDLRLIAPVTSRDGKAAAAELLIGLVPPCTLVTLRIVAPQGTRFTESSTTIDATVRLKLVFAETDRSWYLDGSHLKLLRADEDLQRIPQPGTLPKLLGFRFDREPVTDCAEGS